MSMIEEGFYKSLEVSTKEIDIEIKVGQVWQLKDELVMICCLNKLSIGKVIKLSSTYAPGFTYALVESPRQTTLTEIRSGTFVFDTEKEN